MTTVNGNKIIIKKLNFKKW